MALLFVQLFSLLSFLILTSWRQESSFLPLIGIFGLLTFKHCQCFTCANFNTFNIFTSSSSLTSSLSETTSFRSPHSFLRYSATKCRGGGGYGLDSCRKQCPLNRMFSNYLSTFQKVFYESLTKISLGKIKSSANQRCSPVGVSVNWRVNCIIRASFSRNLKPLKKLLAAPVKS